MAWLSLLSCAAAGSTLEDSNPICLVADDLRDFETQVLQIIGQTRHTFSFARFAHRYGKSYETVDQMKFRYHIFFDNLKLIRSINRKNLSYTLGVNRLVDVNLVKPFIDLEQMDEKLKILPEAQKKKSLVLVLKAVNVGFPLKQILLIGLGKSSKPID